MDVCGICLDTLSEGSSLPCNHRFHSLCVEPWLLKKGTCPTCRHRVADTESDAESDEEYDIERIRGAVLDFWQQRYPLHFPVFQHIDYEPVPRPPIDYSTIVQNIVESDTEWTYTVHGVDGRSTKADVVLVQNQTEATLPTCLYALHIHANDIVNAILYISC